MFPGYHRSFNAHALQFMDRGVDIPDIDLGVGFAENLAPVLHQVDFTPVMQPPQLPKIKTFDQATVDGQGHIVDPASFPATGYLGEVIGGF